MYLTIIYLYILNSLNFTLKKTPIETKNISNIKSKFLKYVSYRVDTMYFTVCTLDKLLVPNISIFSFE